MKQPHHSTNMLIRTATRPVAVRLAFVLLVSVVGAQSAHAFIENTATAAGEYEGNAVASGPITVQVPVVPNAPGLEVTKTATPNSNVPAGTTVTYVYTVRNSGNTVLTNITLNDVHIGNGTPPTPGNEILSNDFGALNDSTDVIANDGQWSSLAPGDTITFTANYTVIQSDVDQHQ